MRWLLVCVLGLAFLLIWGINSPPFTIRVAKVHIPRLFHTGMDVRSASWRKEITFTALIGPGDKAAAVLFPSIAYLTLASSPSLTYCAYLIPITTFAACNCRAYEVGRE